MQLWRLTRNYAPESAETSSPGGEVIKDVFSIVVMSLFSQSETPSPTSTFPRKGTAVDAAIAALFCNGVSNPHSMGLGGGFLMTVYLANGTAVRSSLCREKTLNYVYMMTS